MGGACGHQGRGQTRPHPSLWLRPELKRDSSEALLSVLLFPDHGEDPPGQSRAKRPAGRLSMGGGLVLLPTLFPPPRTFPQSRLPRSDPGAWLRMTPFLSLLQAQKEPTCGEDPDGLERETCAKTPTPFPCLLLTRSLDSSQGLLALKSLFRSLFPFLPVPAPGLEGPDVRSFLDLLNKVQISLNWKWFLHLVSCP